MMTMMVQVEVVDSNVELETRRVTMNDSSTVGKHYHA